MPRRSTRIVLIVAVLLISVALGFYVRQIIVSRPVAVMPPGVCVPKWNCTEWSFCKNGVQERKCSDINNCGIFNNQPSETQNCSPAVQPPQPPHANPPPAVRPPPPPPLSVNVSLAFAERIFDSATDHCNNSLIEGPDLPVHAFRNQLSELVLISGNAPDNYAMFGTNFNNLHRDCSQPVFRSGDKWRITDFAPQQWLFAPYVVGNVVHALLHNEYHDPVATNCKPGETTPANPCWYNFITYAQSTDGGHTFTQVAGDAKVVAILPTQWNPTDPGSGGPGNLSVRPDPHGYFSPMNIMKKGNYYYSIFQATFFSYTGKRGSCIMRTSNLSDPHSWKMWDGHGFNISYFNPYPTEATNPDQYRCALISWDNLFENSGPVTYNTYLGKYLMVLSGIYENQGNPLTCGIWYSLSDDLINWKKPKLIIKTKFDFFPDCEPTTFKGGYPSIIDHDSTSPNFETSGRTPYLYYVLGDSPPGGSFSILERRRLTFTVQ